jgi:outer membrane protein assembly factor BamB
MTRWIGAAATALAVALAAAHPAGALVKNITPLKAVLAYEEFIFVAKVDKLYPEKPALVLGAGESLKGRAPFDRMPVNLTGDKYGQSEKHAPQLLRRLAPDLNVIVFAHKQGTDYQAFVYSNGTWFNMTGQVVQGEPVKWSFNHCEPYLRRTFKGTTEELRQAIVDGLSGKKAPPAPDEKEPPGLGPEIKSDEKPKEKPNAGLLIRSGRDVLSSGGPATLPFAVIPTFVLIGPLAILAALFPTVFGGLAVLMKRWSAALSISCLVSTVWFLQMLFIRRLAGTWWGTQAGLWVTLTAITACGAIWSGIRYRKALREADFETFQPRKWDFIGLIALSLAGIGGVAFALAGGKKMLERPWLDLLVSCVPVWVATVALLFVRSGPEGTSAFSLEGAFLWGLVFACANVVALEIGRAEGSGVQLTAETGGRQPRFTKTAWKFEPDKNGAVFCKPLLVGDRLYFSALLGGGFSQYGAILCLNANTGEELWRFDNDGKMKIAFSSPSLAEGRLFVGEGFHEDSGCNLFCLDAGSGKKIWEFPTASHTESSPVVLNGRVYFGAGDDGVFCANAADGKQVWNFPGFHVDATPQIHGGRLYVGSGVGDKFNTTAFLCLDAETGKEVWKAPLADAAFAEAILFEDRVIFGTGNGNFGGSAPIPKGAVICLAAGTGKPIWQRDLPDTVLCKPAYDSSALYVTSRDGSCYALDPSDGRVKWQRSLGAPIVSSPILAAEGGELDPARSLYAVATNARFVCLNAETGGVFWTQDFGRMEGLPAKDVSATPVVIPISEGAVERRRIILAVNFANDVTKFIRVYCFEDEVK